MAFSEEDKHRIIFALCLPATILDSNSVNYNSIVNDRLTGLSSYAEDRALYLVSKIESLKEKLETSINKNNVKQIGDIVLDTEGSDSLTKKEYSRLATELGSLLDIKAGCKGSSRMSSVWV